MANKIEVKLEPTGFSPTPLQKQEMCKMEYHFHELQIIPRVNEFIRSGYLFACVKDVTYEYQGGVSPIAAIVSIRA